MRLDGSWFRRRRVEADLREEVAEHMRLREADLVARGREPGAARRQARLEFGAEENYREQARAAAGTLSLETVLQDLRFGLRLLRKAPAFTLTAVLMLALGLGANTAIFSMVDWLLLRPLPVPQAQQLTYLVVQEHGGMSDGFSYPNLADIRTQTGSVFSQVAGLHANLMDGLTVDGHTRTIWTNHVSGNFFALLGLRPALGRFFAPEEGESPGSASGVVLSYELWQSQFGGNRNVIGSPIAVNGRAASIIGVAPKGFQGPLVVLKTQAYLPFSMIHAGEFGQHGDFFHDRADGGGVMILARRRAGVSLAQARAQLNVVGQRLARQYPQADPWQELSAKALTAEPPGPAPGPDPLPMVAGLFLALAGVVLLLACVNIANLLLARAAVRRREMAMRAALGAGRARLMRQMLIESLLLATLGGLAGLAVALGACRALNALPLGPAASVSLSFGMDWRVFVYSAVLALAAGVAVGLLPAWRASRPGPGEVLHAAAGEPGARTRLRSGLVIAEIAGSLVLLVVAGLFVRSLRQAQRADLGFHQEGVINITLDPHAAGMTSAQGAAFYAALLQRARDVPGVGAAALAASIPFGYYRYVAGVKVAGSNPDPGAIPLIDYNSITPGYFTAMGMHLLQGRGFRAGEAASTPRVAVVSAAMARRFWPRGGALGSVFTTERDPARAITVVGVVNDVRSVGLAGPAEPNFYLPLAQEYRSPVILQLRVAGGDAAVVTAVRAAIAQLAPAVPIVDVQTMSAALYSFNGLLLYEMGAMLAALMGGVGLLMAVIGIYGVLAYAASQRTREIGVRMALGANRGQVLRLVFGRGLGITAAGLGLGLLLAAGASRLLAGLLVGVGSLDPVTYGAATVLLAAVALAASLAPALRAVRTDPIAVLRQD